MKLTNKLLVCTSACLMALSLAGCGTSGTNAQNSSSTASANETSRLASMNYKSGKQAWININHDRSTLNPRSWKRDHVVYSNLDHENRTSRGNTGWLDKKNVANDSLRTQQIFKPTGYHQKFVNGEAIINRGHEIAYSLSKGIDKKGQYKPSLESGDQNNPKNLFTQTAFSNQEVQTIFESKVRNALKHNEKVIYQVKPIFKGHDLMAKGVQMQAVSTNHKLDFNVFLYNVQPGMKFNYANGRSSVDRAMRVPTPKGAPHFNDNKAVNNRFTHRASRRYGFRRYRPYRNHHLMRKYVAYRVAKHMIHHHYAKKYGYHRYGYNRYHKSFMRKYSRNHYRRW